MNKPRILIVEDGDSQRFLLRGFLVREGYWVGEAENGLQAIELLRGENFDIILLDHKMRGLSGFDVLREVKKSNPEIDVVMISRKLPCQADN